MEALVVHREAQAIASWLSSSVALRHRLRSRLLTTLPKSSSIDFFEVVIAWDSEAPC